jgi:hypothetical protein
MIKDYSEWYSAADTSTDVDVVGSWLVEEQRALAEGFNGLRIAGNPSFLTRDSWSMFMGSETNLDEALEGRRILALCTYPRPLGASDMLDVAQCHDCALERVDQGWHVVSPGSRQSVGG